MSASKFQLTKCPVAVYHEDNDAFPGACDASIDCTIDVHSDGAEFGVWATLWPGPHSAPCGHNEATIAKTEQMILLGEI